MLLSEIELEKFMSPKTWTEKEFFYIFLECFH